MINYDIFPQLKKKKTTVGELYNPLIHYAVKGSPIGLVYLESVIEYVMNSDKTISLSKATDLVRNNLDYWCQYFDKESEQKTKEFYSLGLGFRDLMGVKHGKDLTPQELFDIGFAIGKKTEELEKKTKQKTK